MFCSASKENVAKFVRVVNSKLSSLEGPFSLEDFSIELYNTISKATNSHEKALEYIRMVPSITMSLIASTNSSPAIKKLIVTDAIPIATIAKMSVEFSDKTNGWNSVDKYIQDIATSKADAIAIINSTPTEVVSGENVAVAESENPKVRDAKILNAARKLTVLSTYDREVDDFDSNTINQASAPAFAIKRKILDLLPSAGYDSSKIKYQGVDGFIFKATSSKNIPLDQLRPDQNVENWTNNEGVVILLTDNSGNPIKVDANGDVSDSGKYVYFKIRNTDNINVGSLSARDKENIAALSRAEQIDLPSATAKYIDDINELADIRKEALSGKDVNLIINGGSVGWASNDHKFRNRISSVTNLGNTPILRYDKNNPARGIFDGMAYIKIGGMYGQNVPIERPRINSESEHKDLLINLLTGDLVDSKGKAISSSARAKLVAPFLMVSEKTQEDVESKNRIFFKDNKLVLGLHSFDISKPSSRQLAREELTKFLSEVRPERRIFESEIREYHERLKASDTPSINSVAPLTDSDGGVVMARNESTKKMEALYNVYDVAKMHVNFSLVDKSFKMPELKSIGDNKFEVSTSEQDYNEFIKSNFFINLRLTSDNKAQLTNPYATFERAPISEEVIEETSEGAEPLDSPEIDAIEQEILDSSNSNNVHEAIVFNIGNYHISQSEIYNLKNIERKGISSDGLSIGDVAKSIKQKNGLKESVAEIEDFIKEYLINGEKDYSYNYDVSRPSSIKRKLSKLRAEYKKVNGIEYVSKLDRAITFDEYIKNTDEQFSNAYQKASGTLASATDVKNAKEWWSKHPLSKVIAFNEAFNIANTIDENNIASFNDYAITLFKGSDSTEIYHEAWHAFTSKFLSDKEKSELYREASKVKGSFNDANGNSVKFSDASDKQLEEYLAERFRDYAISKNRKGISNKIKAIFDKILRFLNTAFNGYSKPSATSNPYIKEMFEKLRLGNIRNNTFEINGTLTEFQKRDVNNRINTYLHEYVVGSNNSNTYSYSEDAISESALDYAKSAIQSELQDKQELLVSSGDSNVAKEVNYLSFVLNNWDKISKEALDLNTAVADGVDSNVNNLVHLAATQSSVYEVMEGIKDAFDTSSNPTEIERALNKDTRTKSLMALIGSSNTNAPLEANLFNSFINSFNGLGTNERSVVNTKGFISLANGELMTLGKVFSKNIKTSKNEANLISPEYYRLLSIGSGTWTSENEAKYSNQDYSFEPLELTSNGESLGLYEISSSEDTFTTKNGERVELNSLGVIGKEKLSGNNVITQPISRGVATSTEVDGHYKGYRLSNNAESISETELSFNESEVFAEFVNKNFGIANNVDFIDYNEYKSYKIESIIAEKYFAKDFRYEALIDSAKEQLVKEKNESNEAFNKRVEDYAQKMWVRDVALQRSGNKDYMSNSATALLPTILDAFPALKNNTFVKSLSIEDSAINIKNSSLSLSELNEIKQAFYSLENRDVIKTADVAANNAISEYFHSLIDASDVNGWNLGAIRDREEYFDDSVNSDVERILVEEESVINEEKTLSLSSFLEALSVDNLDILGGAEAIVQQYEQVASFMTEEEFIQSLNCKL